MSRVAALELLICIVLLSVWPPPAIAAQAAATITASPNPVPPGSGKGRTTISWSAAGESTCQVWSSTDGQDEELFDERGCEGSRHIDWVETGSRYVYTLYQGTSRSKVLAAVDVQRENLPPVMTATPNPVTTDAAGFNGKTTIAWNTGNGKPGTVFVSVNGGPETLVARGVGGTADAPWIRRHASWDFVLYDGAHRERLASVEVSPATTGARVAMTLTFGASLLVAIAAMFVRHGDAIWRQRLYTVLAVAVTAAALLPILASEPRPMDLQPFPDAHQYADGARQIVSGKGYVTYVRSNDARPDDGQPRPPKYPPGFSLALLPFAAAGPYPDAVLAGAKWFAALYVIAAVAAAWSVGGALAGMLTAGLIGVSPFGEQSASLLLSDAFAAALTLLLVPLLNKPSGIRMGAAGFIAASTLLVRYSLIIVVVALVFAVRGHARRRAALLATPVLAALVAYQWLTFGSPAKTGYQYESPGTQRFSVVNPITSSIGRDQSALFPDATNGRIMRWVCPCPEGGAQAAFPNVIFFPLVLTGVFWIYAPPLVPVLGAVYLWRHRREPTAALAMYIVVLTVGLQLFFFFQDARFMAAPATLLTVFAAVSVAQWAERRTGTNVVRAVETL